jgi:N-acetylglucosamine kinase-like BadF-type ATPase
MYFLGVDGGNTKTDYVLCKTDGSFVNLLRTGTCSHEQFADGFDGMERTMRAQLDVILSRYKITAADVAAAGFGLAGADLPWQVEELEKRVAAMGFARFGVANDGILGIKGSCESGVGLCAVNGTGTVVLGADESGEILQVGGVGRLSGDAAGGGYIRDRIICALYDFYYRCGEDSVMFPHIMDIMKIKPDDLPELVYGNEWLNKNMTEIIKAGVKAAAKGDAVAKSIFDGVGISIARSAAGCIRRLNFAKHGTPEAPIDIVQVGSIWKVAYSGMNKIFLETVQKLSNKNCRIVTQKMSAAVGGVLWAKEILDGVVPCAKFREKINTSGGNVL